VLKTGQAAAHGCHKRRAIDGQSNEEAADGVLPKEEARKRVRKGYLRDGEEVTNDHLRDAEEGVGLLVLGRSLVQSEAAVAECRRLNIDFA
jgi:hypothetical protein